LHFFSLLFEDHLGILFVVFAFLLFAFEDHLGILFVVFWKSLSSQINSENRRFSSVLFPISWCKIQYFSAIHHFYILLYKMNDILQTLWDTSLQTILVINDITRDNVCPVENHKLIINRFIILGCHGDISFFPGDYYISEQQEHNGNHNLQSWKTLKVRPCHRSPLEKHFQ